MSAPHEHLSPSLQQIEKESWQLLVTGSQNPKDGFYTGTLGTQTTAGVSLRTVVLREVNPAEKTIICYSDVRADKVQEIRQHSEVCFLFWDSEKKIQLRLNGKANIYTNDTIALQHWQRTSLSNRRSYLAIPAPGSPQPNPTSGLPQELDSREPTEEESAKGRHNFAVITAHIEYLDWLFLSNSGHRRAKFMYKAGKLILESWIIP